ncbi:MAG: hypothetical protein ACHREM_25930 [Polyangiales bacterium]
MQFEKREVNARAVAINRGVERVANRVIRGYDAFKSRIGLAGRAAAYDDLAYEFVGGARDSLRRKHYDKSLRLLWKAEVAAPWSSFRDAAAAEHALLSMADQGMSADERHHRARITSAEFRAMLDREYTPAQKRALVTILSAIGHGEAYAWLVSASLLTQVQSTGAKAAVTMQVVEEAKHFVVLRELIQAFGIDVPRLSAWEYLLLEGALKARGLDKFFGMNVIIETIALNIFGLLSDKPGLEILRLFHLDESRHTALPDNYFKEFPMTAWERHNPRARVSRLAMALPSLPLVLLLEEELGEIGVDAFDFAGAILRKTATLSVRAGFLTRAAADGQSRFFNGVFNRYCELTRPQHRWRDYMAAETTRGAAESAVEREIFGEPSAPEASSSAASTPQESASL